VIAPSPLMSRYFTSPGFASPWIFTVCPFTVAV